MLLLWLEALNLSGGIQYTAMVYRCLPEAAQQVFLGSTELVDGKRRVEAGKSDASKDQS